MAAPATEWIKHQKKTSCIFYYAYKHNIIEIERFENYSGNLNLI
jgi:hypothetical protein